LRTLSPPINLSDPTTSSQIPSTQKLPDPKAIDSLPLLNAILKEILRRYPPSPAHLDRVTPPAGAVIDGFVIPGGTVVGTSSVGMHQNAYVFPNPEEFRPERWLVDDEEKLREMNRWFWAFGSGGRMCIGSHFAIYCEFHLSVFETEHFGVPSEVGIETCGGNSRWRREM
jgi:cytochrome P450